MRQMIRVEEEVRRERRTGEELKVYVVYIDYDLPTGKRLRRQKVAPATSKRAAESWANNWFKELLKDEPKSNKKEVPTFEDWFEGRFWREWVVGRQNKPSERESKMSIFRVHLQPYFGKKRLDEIVENDLVDDYRAHLVERHERGELSLKRINNILAVISTALKYAAKKGVIARAPEVGIFKIASPEIEWWEFDEYARVLVAARQEGPMWYAASCLAGEEGVRIGEVRALVWERDVDLIAGTLTVTEQTRKGVTGTPKGRTRRKVPMTTTALEALKALDVVRRGYVVRNPDGSQLRDGQTTHTIYRICRRAGLPERGWHTLRHTFGTHAAMFGVNPWKLMAWMGHKSLATTLKYVHLSGDHARPIPGEVLAAAQGEPDPDLRIVKMLGARAGVVRTLRLVGGNDVDEERADEKAKG